MSELRDQPLYAPSSEAVTNNVRVEVVSQYAPEHSQPFQHEWFFHYTVRISNEGDETVQLLTRMSPVVWRTASLCAISRLRSLFSWSDELIGRAPLMFCLSSRD